MAASEIRDAESLKSWLEARPEATRQRDAVWIATRAAARVYPLYGRTAGRADDVASRGRDVTALPILRCLLTSGDAAVSRTPGVNAAFAAAANRAAFAANRAADADFAANRANAVGFAANRANAAANAADAAANAANAAANAANAAANAAAAIRAFAAAAIRAAPAANAADFAAARGKLWQETRTDAQALENAGDVPVLPLWSDQPPDWFFDADRAMGAIWADDPPGTWDFWVRWWTGVQHGKPLPWELQRRVALIEDQVWRAGPEAVAEAIRKIEDELAFDLTENGEGVEVNPETGRLRLVPDTDLPEDVADYARRKLGKARALFVEPLPQHLVAIRPELDLLTETLSDASNLPVELFDTCASISRRVATRAKAGECPAPEDDAVLGDFMNRIRDAGADILAADPKTQQTLARRNVILGNRAMAEGRETMLEAAREIADLSEGLLARLPKLVATATESADQEDAKIASFKVAGRILRVHRLFLTAGYVISGAAGFGLSVAGTFLTVEGLANSPWLKAAVAIIWRWLNFG